MEVEAEGNGSDGVGGDDSVIERKDAEGSTGVELTEEAWVGERIVEDAGDEEAGQNEEQVDAVRPKGESAMQDGLEGGMRSEREQVGAENAENCEATHTIQGRYVPRVGACFRYIGTGIAGRHLC